MFPRSTHETFAQKLYQTFKSHKRFSKPKLSRSDFTICHYAGDVTYQTELFLDKNKDYVVAEHQALLTASRCSFVSGPFPLLAQESSKLSKFYSIATITIISTEPHYICCVKPNNLLKPSIFENRNVLQQLQCGGVMEAIRISCAGYPTKKPFVEFLDQFGLLEPEVLDGSSDEIAACKKLLEKVGLQGYQIGKTKVFLRAGQMAELDTRRSEVLGRSASIIQRKIHSYLAHRKQLACKVYDDMRREAASLRIQRHLRMHLARKILKELRSFAVSIQTVMRGIAARNELCFRRQTKAAIIIQAASETGALQVAKNKLEKQVEELTWRLQMEKRMRDSESSRGKKILN
ncbi:hypothetical protein F3Y22_tig00111812pilonHSYRG00246 [Hibiscus syriacus]|uniref:Myosin motor domain-containing protein n=1 Tax=Hibiscus syriacus TaxID=106335 RepID=A0A6A2XBT8_HIBSY|nr:hypothetical protein F3Y22_tig00111812pilonHSYRG00246 [Hibiscus syriacus]